MRLQTRTALLVEAIYKWLNSTALNKKALAAEIVEAIETSGKVKLLDICDVSFKKSDDPDDDRARNYEKLFRWLGLIDIKEQPSKLWHIEQYIVAAMPDEIKTEYLNNVYGQSGVSVTTSIVDANGTVDIDALLSSLIKEHSDIQRAVIELPRAKHISTLKQIRKEAQEAIAITQSAFDVVNEMIERQQSSEQLKAV